MPYTSGQVFSSVAERSDFCWIFHLPEWLAKAVLSWRQPASSRFYLVLTFRRCVPEHFWKSLGGKLGNHREGRRKVLLSATHSRALSLTAAASKQADDGSRASARRVFEFWRQKLENSVQLRPPASASNESISFPSSVHHESFNQQLQLCSHS